ncbi:helix-turn-helix domain-containing protein [Metabacillus hrfriensis]|uniref:AraC family transcriptional regulator n=1 Tax=Metabacillus hrfriensis TaxID=3048891 RepID=A0ACD4RFK6_9BACI|nr:AraC family transcriptional regulator [Metabacillus sp. CT-WN-B3]WHZ58960.1 AraC family transcriptional regulator [Metabacillus sp. CT-WN-B3]
MYNVTFIVEETAEKDKMAAWIHEELEDSLQTDEGNKIGSLTIAVVEIAKLFDWVKIHRLQKQHHDCIIFPLLDTSMLKTSPIAIELQLQSMLVKPVKKHTFIKSLRKVITSNKNESAVITNYDSIVQQMEQDRGTDARLLPFQEAFLRRLLRAEVKSEEELFAARPYLPDNSVPNAVCFIQGFIHNQSREKAESAPLLIQTVFKELFSQVGQQPSFLAYKKHLLMLIQVPHGFSSIRTWQEGESKLLHGIEVLKNKHGIHLYIGVGSIYREPLLLSNSYREARKARRTPHYNRLSLRYFEEITDHPQINTCTSFIAEHCQSDLTTKIVADQINISVPYFCKLFKKETGRSFVEYVTFVRLQRAVWMLRHTDQTIEQIADELGFNTPNYFSSTFKKYVSITPSEYRLTDEILFV